MSENETLLDIAKRNLYVAKLIFRQKNDDEGLLNNVGYNLQQAIELGIKHHLESNGIRYPMSHDIEELLDYVPDSDRDLFSNIDSLAGSITRMEAKTRYVKNFRLSLRIIEKVFPLAEELIQTLEKHELKNKVMEIPA